MGAGLPKQAPATLQGVWEGQDGASHFRCEIAGSNLKMERHSGAVHTSKSFPVSNWGTNKWSGCFCCCCCSATVAGDPSSGALYIDGVQVTRTKHYATESTRLAT